MSEKVVTIAMNADYPFGVSREHQQPRTLVQVRKVVDLTLEPRYVMKEKIRCLKSLGPSYLVALLTTSEEDRQMNLIFEYVHRKLRREEGQMEAEQISKVQAEMLELGELLARHCVVHEFQLDNVGLDRLNRLKYFLGFAFKIDRNVNKQQLNERYRQTIQNMFRRGSHFVGNSSPVKIFSREYGETMDSSPGRVTPGFEQRLVVGQSRGRQTMHQVQLQVQNPKQNEFSELEEWWQGNSSEANKIVSIDKNQKYQREATNEMKAVKIEDLGARINKLKNYMREVTGKTPKNSGGISQFKVMIDSNNHQNRIVEENKMFITPNYTKLEKIIAEFRASRFYRGYGEKEIVYQKDDKCYQVNTKERIQSRQCVANRPSVNSIAYQQKELPSSSPSAPRKEMQKYYAGPTLKKDNSLVERQKERLKEREKEREREQEMERQKEREREREREREKEKELSKQQNHPDRRLSMNTSSYEEEYHKLGKTDKYCEQFMFFLDDEHHQVREQEMPTLTHLISQMGRQQKKSVSSRNRVQKNVLEKSGSSVSNESLQSRVQNAIRNSLTLINGMKYRQSQFGK